MNNHDLLDDNYDEIQDARDEGDFFNAFDDGFDDVLSNRRSSVVDTQSIHVKPSDNS